MSIVGVTRWIRGYDKLHGKLLVEYRLPESWTLERLRSLFGVAEDNPMYDCFFVDKTVAKTLEPSIGSPLVGDDREFFLEADAED
jgi:hypothetical protein